MALIIRNISRRKRQKIVTYFGRRKSHLGLENGKKRFIDEVAKLSQSLYSGSVPSNERWAKDEVRFPSNQSQIGEI